MATALVVGSGVLAVKGILLLKLIMLQGKLNFRLMNTTYIYKTNIRFGSAKLINTLIRLNKNQLMWSVDKGRTQDFRKGGGGEIT